MLFGHKNRLQVDLGDLQNEKERLASFLGETFKTPINEDKGKLSLEAENLSVLELQKEVTKYLHRHNLSRAYYVSVESKTVKINRFRTHDKKKGKKKEQPTQGLTQSWGL